MTRSTLAAGRPADQCPYPRPFPADFCACPAYQQTQFVPLDTHHQLLGSVWTCGHLDVRAATAGGRFYPRCRIGDAEGRLRYVERARADRLGRLRRLQVELTTVAFAFVEDLWAAKGRQLAAMESRRDAAAETAELRSLTRRYLDRVRAFLEERSDTLAALHLPLEACMALLEVLIDAFVEQPNAETPRVRGDILARFPEDVRILLSPDAA